HQALGHRRWTGNSCRRLASGIRQIRARNASQTTKGERRPRHRSRPCHRQGHHGGTWRLDRGREPGGERPRDADRADVPQDRIDMTVKTRILVVDDEPAILRFLRPALAANDYEVTTSGTVADATKRIASEVPDVIVLDLGLPD